MKLRIALTLALAIGWVSVSSAQTTINVPPKTQHAIVTILKKVAKIGLNGAEAGVDAVHVVTSAIATVMPAEAHFNNEVAKVDLWLEIEAAKL